MAALAASHEHWRSIVERTGLPPPRLREGGFPGLAAIIVSQQLSVASARAVWTRFESVFVPLTPERLLAATDDDMRLSGLSRPKQRTSLALSAALAEVSARPRGPRGALARGSPRADDGDFRHRPLDGRCLSAALPRPPRRLRRRRPRDPGSRPPCLRPRRTSEAGRARGHGRGLAASARRRRPPALGLLCCAEAPRRHQRSDLSSGSDPG